MYIRFVKFLLVILIVLAYLSYCFFIIKKIRTSTLLDDNKKTINIILCILLPFVWGVLLFIILGPSTEGTASPKNKKDIDSDRGWTKIEAGEG